MLNCEFDMSSFKNEIFTAFDALIPPGPLLVGFSGGLDSTVLLHLLHEYTARQSSLYQLKAIHVHHGISANADDWAEHCRVICEKLTIPFLVERVSLIRESRQSLEAIARTARYQVFEKYLEGGALITAHHQDDQLETLLLALKRGSGPRGLAGMPAVMSFAHGKLIRPLLNFSREDMERWAIETGLTWINDESNADNTYDRNFLRNEIIPHLKQRWPELGKTAARSAELCAEQENLITDIAAQDLSMVICDNGALDIAKLSLLSEPRRHQVLRFWLREKTALVPSAHQLHLIWQEVALAREDATPLLVWEAGTIRRYRNQLWLQNQEMVEEVNIPELILNHTYDFQIAILNLHITENEVTGLRLPFHDEVVSICFNLSGSTKVHPSNRQHQRELKKLWHEFNVAPWLRSIWPVICYNGQVVAIPGLFIVKEFQTEVAGLKIKIMWEEKER